MPRVNLDECIWNDSRAKRLRIKLNLPMPFVVGMLAAIWSNAYARRSPIMSRDDVDMAAEHEICGHMIASGLAIDRGDGTVHLCGVVRRIEYLKDQSSRARAGGIARVKKAARAPSGRLAKSSQTAGVHQPVTQPVAGPHQPNSSPPHTPDPSPAPDLPLSPDPDLPPDPGTAERASTSGLPRLHHDESGPDPEWWGNPKPKPAKPIKPKSEPKGSRLDEQWQPGPVALPEGVNPISELERFKDYCRANGKRYLDWQAAWRNWLRNASDFAARKPKKQEDGLAVALRIARGEA